MTDARATHLTDHDWPLHTDAVRVLTDWAPPTAKAEADRQHFLKLLRTGPAALRREHSAGHLTASAVVLSADRSRVLLVLHGRFHRWVQPGGHCEPADATLAAAALREATEESGIAGLRLYEEPIDVDIHPVTCSAGPSVHYDVRFAALAPAGATPMVSDESDALGWFDPDALPEPLATATERVVRAAVTRTGARPGS